MEGIFYNKHYILVDEAGHITDGWSNGPAPNRSTSGAICINEQGDYPFRLFPDGDENPALVNDMGVYLYTYDKGNVQKVPESQVEEETQKAAQKLREEAQARAAQKQREESLVHQMQAAAALVLTPMTTLSDEQALQVPDLLPVWPSGTDTQGNYRKGQVVRDPENAVLYRIVPETVKPLESQPPHAEGMLAVYRPVEQTHQGTEEDPIPWVYGMDCLEGLYYSYNGLRYRVAEGGTMAPCVWAPDTPGLWQWEPVG